MTAEDLIRLGISPTVYSDAREAATRIVALLRTFHEAEIDPAGTLLALVSVAQNLGDVIDKTAGSAGSFDETLRRLREARAAGTEAPGTVH